MKPKRIQLSRKKGWRMPPNTVVVSRPSRWGNPYAIGPFQPALTCVEKFEAFVMRRPDMIEDIKRNLRGKNLACWCALDKPCHADVLMKIANEDQGEKSSRQQTKDWLENNRAAHQAANETKPNQNKP